MKSTVNLQLDTDLLHRLHVQLNQRGGNGDLTDAIASAITFWLAAAAPDPHSDAPAATRGYQWKSLFLPHGTELRSWSYGEHNYARVEGDQIIHQGRSVSPNQFAQAFARTTRNAWFDLSIRRPGDKYYTLACRLRQDLARQANAPASVAQAAPIAPASPAVQIAPAAPAAQITRAAPSAQAAAAAPADPASLALSALLSHLLAVSPAARAASATPPSPAPAATAPAFASPCGAPPGGGWTLPERRRRRFWTEDVAVG